MQATPANPAQTPGILLLVCAALLAVGLFTKGWATASEGRETIAGGLFGFEGCRGSGKCSTASWDEAAKALDLTSDVETFRIIGMIAGFFALAGLLVTATLTLAGNVGKVPLKPVVIVLSLAAGSLTYFTIRFAMSDRDVDFGPSYSAFLAIGGLVAAGLIMRLKLRPLVEQARAGGPRSQGAPPQHAQQPPQQQPPQHQPPQQTHPCHQCGGPAHFVAEHQRWYCPSCQQYVG